MTDHLTFQVLGGLRAQRDGVELDLGGARQRRVLSVLLLSLGRPIPAERLAELVWGDDAPASTRISLQSYISKLRTLLEPDRRPGAPSQVIATRTGGYLLEIEPPAVDIWQFEADVTAAQAAHASDRIEDAIELLGPALQRWSPVLPELADEPFVLAAAGRSAAVRATGVELLARARLALGDHHAAIVDLRTAVAEDPRAEGLCALLAVALYRCGRQAEALDAVASARRTLREECGLDVGDELRRLEADLLAQAPSLAAPVGPTRAIPAATESKPISRPVPVPRSAGCPVARRRRPSPIRRCASLTRPA